MYSSVFYSRPPLSATIWQNPVGLYDIVVQRGYSWREYSVVTQDGYILTMQRINGKNISRPVFIQHGVLSSSVDWLIGIACVLADSGFDVWLGNVRGNIYSRAHSTLSPDEDEFWNFSFEDHAAFDIPAMVSFVLTSTNKDQLVYIGHSQGSLIGLIQLSRNQEFADKVALMIALAPTLSFQGVYCPFLSLAPYYRHFYVYSYLLQSSIQFLSLKTTPPLYNVSNIHTPIVIVASEDDVLFQNVRFLESTFPNVVESIWLDNFAHLDFVLGREVVDRVYKPLISAIERH
ncbi:lysosomal acid lipase/cholesteryl ester hydrolase-like [Octopus sinensis]|uniref:Lysosomal acid lipase/cholesteryl ester hydrolase-like n=1 Tax=Octopus sinensis TaxID=2607531 RepID=A0A6P7U461_9MOLL|nr:lysosomal acid lipase/cholesteryl ester hydrolase-like [Octopus sinensis]